MEKEKQLKLEVIWKDDEMFEIQVKVSNGRYAGTTEVYEQYEALLNFSYQLRSYPLKETLSHSCGERGNYVFFEMKFYPIGISKIGVLISIEENTPTESRVEEKDKLSIELLIEQNSLDNFQKELFDLAYYQKGSATLIGN